MHFFFIWISLDYKIKRNLFDQQKKNTSMNLTFNLNEWEKRVADADVALTVRRVRSIAFKLHITMLQVLSV